MSVLFDTPACEIYARETKAEADIAKVLTFDEARRIAVNVAKLRGLLSRNERASDGVDLDKGLENPSHDQAKQNQRAHTEQL